MYSWRLAILLPCLALAGKTWPSTCKSTADCDTGYNCQAVPPGARQGKTYCVKVNISGEMEPGWAGCTSDADCTGGGLEGICSVAFNCGGPAPPPENTCYYDECDLKKQDCPQDSYYKMPQACVPAGSFNPYQAHCVRANCVQDSDCSARSGGQCVLLGGFRCAPNNGFYCTYDSGECRSDEDCKSHKELMAPMCAYNITAKEPTCTERPPPPPSPPPMTVV